MHLLADNMAWSDLIVLMLALLILAVAGVFIYGAVRQKRIKMKRFEDIFEYGDDNFTPEEIRDAVRRDLEKNGAESTDGKSTEKNRKGEK